MAGTLITNIQLGDSATPTQNFTLTAAAANGTCKLARGTAAATTQDILSVDIAGNVNALVGLLINGSAAQSLANFTGTNQSLAATGSQDFPGGLKLKWGSATSSAAGAATVTFTTPFPTACFLAVGFIVNGGAAPTAVVNSTPTTTGFGFTTFTTTTGAGLAQSCVWFALGI